MREKKLRFVFLFGIMLIIARGKEAFNGKKRTLKKTFF